MDPLWVMACVETLVGNVIESVEKVRDDVAKTRDIPFLHELARRIAERAKVCESLLG
jgi:hypothetical protein